MRGPRLLFHCDTVIAVAGAPADVSIDGQNVESARAIHVRQGETFSVGWPSSGYRCYIAFQGGVFVCPRCMAVDQHLHLEHSEAITDEY
jgi:allophanate hydrolase subunit 2